MLGIDKLSVMSCITVLRVRYVDHAEQQHAGCDVVTLLSFSNRNELNGEGQ